MGDRLVDEQTLMRQDGEKSVFDVTTLRAEDAEQIMASFVLAACEVRFPVCNQSHLCSFASRLRQTEIRDPNNATSTAN